MYGDVLPKTNLLIPVLSREYVGHNGILGNLINLPVSEGFDTFPTWYMTKHGKGATLNDFEGDITELIARNENVVKERDNVGRSPLHLICSVHSPGQINVVRALCSARSANVNVLDTMHRTPLHHVLSPFNLEYHTKNPDSGETLVALIRLLTEFGVNTNAVDIKGVSPLHLALDFHRGGFAGSLKELPVVLEILKESGADMNKIAHTVSCRSGSTRCIRSSLTPLHLACSMDGDGSIDAIKLLLSPENVNCTDSLGRTSLHTVIMSMCKTPRNISFVRDMILPSESDLVRKKLSILLGSGADINLEDIDGMSPLLTAIELFNYEHSVDVIKILLSNGALATRRDREKRTTPLHLACQYFDRSLPELVPYFIKAGARLNVPDHKFCIPFHYALKKRCCSLATLQSLVDAGANVTAVDDENNNSIHIVCSHHQPHLKSVVEFLIDRGCSINGVNRHGNTPLLHLLQSDYDKESIQALIEMGADCRVTNREGISPLHLVCRSLAPSKGNAEIVDLIIKGGADVNARDRSMSTPLFYTVKDEPTVDEDVVLLLLLAGANPNFANDLCITPLHVVCSYGNHELANLLVSFGANPNQPNAEGNTPLHDAALAKNGDPRVTCQVLVDAGANLAAQNYSHCTPFLMTNAYQSNSYKFILGRMVMLIHASRYSLTQSELNQLNHNRLLFKFYTDCLSCVRAMESHHLGNSKVTLWSFLLASPMEARRYARNPAILEDLYYIAESATRFRPYSYIIKKKAMDCEYFFILFERSSLSLEKLFPESKFPMIVSEQILSHLNDFEMKSLNIAVLGR